MGRVGRIRTNKALALLTSHSYDAVSPVIPMIEVSEEFCEKKARLQGVRLKEGHE